MKKKTKKKNRQIHIEHITVMNSGKGLKGA